MDQTFIMLAIALILAALVLVAISYGKKPSSKHNREHYQREWLKIMSGLDKNNVASYTVAIFSADKLVDQALKEAGVPGETMGERMKAYNPKFSNANDVWSAHKIRNKLAHEPGQQVSYGLAQKSLKAFKQALKDLGAI